MEIININSDIFYLNGGLLSRDDGPAIEYSSGDKYWFSNGKIHREEGPAFISRSGTKEYWLFNKMAQGDEIKNIKRNKLLNELN